MNFNQSFDVVIVGAGAAGLAAGRRASELGLSFVVVEAMDRIGGRAHTDSSTFAVPWDRGCHWLHSADINPMRELADTYGFTYLKEDPEALLFLNGTFLSDADAQLAYDYVEACWTKVFATGSKGLDVSVATLVDDDHPYYPIFRGAVAGEWSVPVEDMSTLDGVSYRDTDNNWPVAEGYGAIIARRGKEVPVQLSIPVTRIEWNGAGVRVSTGNGTIDAGTVVITVSTRIIQDEVITFDPPLPAWKLEAFDAIQLGNANKVCFALDGRELGPREHASLWARAGDRQGMYFQLRPFGYDLANGYLAGELGAAAEREGSAAIIDVGLNALKSVYGSDIEKKITKSACTTWQTEPWIRGAYGAARPGKAHLRKDLTTQIDNRLFWAGEATSPDFYSTAHGADQSGVSAIEAVAATLKR